MSEPIIIAVTQEDLEQLRVAEYQLRAMLVITGNEDMRAMIDCVEKIRTRAFLALPMDALLDER